MKGNPTPERVQGYADFSRDGVYRYSLSRFWSSDPACFFILLNPSTADADTNDPTVTRCQRRARLMGFGGVVVLNIFALRSTDPANLYIHASPIGPQNDYTIRKLTSSTRCGMIICGWGVHGAHLDRGREVLESLDRQKKIAHVLKMNKDETPGHPLYLPYDLNPFPMWKALA